MKETKGVERLEVEGLARKLTDDEVIAYAERVYKFARLRGETMSDFKKRLRDYMATQSGMA